MSYTESLSLWWTPLPEVWRTEHHALDSVLSVTMSGESLHSLKYCLSWLRWVNEHLDKVIVSLKTVLKEWSCPQQHQQQQQQHSHHDDTAITGHNDLHMQSHPEHRPLWYNHNVAPHRPQNRHPHHPQEGCQRCLHLHQQRPRPRAHPPPSHLPPAVPLAHVHFFNLKRRRLAVGNSNRCEGSAHADDEWWRGSIWWLRWRVWWMGLLAVHGVVWAIEERAESGRGMEQGAQEGDEGVQVMRRVNEGEGEAAQVFSLPTLLIACLARLCTRLYSHCTANARCAISGLDWRATSNGSGNLNGLLEFLVESRCSSKLSHLLPHSSYPWML